MSVSAHHAATYIMSKRIRDSRHAALIGLMSNREVCKGRGEKRDEVMVKGQECQALDVLDALYQPVQ